jgi:hypothetical protein
MSYFCTADDDPEGLKHVAIPHTNKHAANTIVLICFL